MNKQRHRLIAKMAIANKHKPMYKTAAGIPNELMSYLQKHYTRAIPGALAGAGIGGIGGFLTANGGRNMLTGRVNSPTIGDRISSGLTGALGGGMLGGAAGIASPALGKYLSEAAKNGEKQVEKNVAENAAEDAAKRSPIINPRTGKGFTQEEVAGVTTGNKVNKGNKNKNVKGKKGNNNTAQSSQPSATMGQAPGYSTVGNPAPQPAPQPKTNTPPIRQVTPAKSNVTTTQTKKPGMFSNMTPMHKAVGGLALGGLALGGMSTLRNGMQNTSTNFRKGTLVPPQVNFNNNNSPYRQYPHGGI